MLNQLILVGKVNDDIQKEDNKYIVTISINRQFKNINGIYETDLIPIVIWTGIGEQYINTLKKNDIIGIKGRLETKDNQLVVIAEKVTFLSTKKEEE